MRALVFGLISHEIDLWLITGQRMAISAKDAWRMFFDKDSAVFFGAAFFLITFIFPVSPEVEIPWWMKLAGFSLYLFLIPIIYFLQAIVVASVSRLIPNLQFFEPVFLLVTTVVIEVVDNSVSPVIFGEAWTLWAQSASFGEQVAGSFVLFLSLDVLFCYFVLPKKRMKIRRLADADDRPSNVEINSLHADPRTIQTQALPHEIKPAVSTQAEMHCRLQENAAPAMIELDGHEVLITSVLAVRAEEHYVRVWTKEREIYARHPFGELVALMDESDGFSPRRGIWLNFENVGEIHKGDNGKLVVNPVIGPMAIVPKARAREVRQLFNRRHLGPATGRSGSAVLDNGAFDATETGLET